MLKPAAPLILALALVAQVGNSQNKPLTVAEWSNYQRTSTHAEVLGFIDSLRNQTPLLMVETIATSTYGKTIPLLVVGNPLPQKPSEVGDRAVVYIQANIHSGEVEGKEATLMYIRDLLRQKNPAVLENVVLLICPNLNPDGNDMMSTSNRTNQNGPAAVGVRHNGLWLDLNRDAMKLETNEMRGVVANVLNRWDPHVIMDCHTTNGSYHKEPVTFTWMMNPNGDSNLTCYMRDKMMPQMHEHLQTKYGTLNCFYGEFVDQLDYEKGWISDACEPRYFVNYVGLRNRLGILNENYVYAPYKDRVVGCYNLIATLVEYASKHRAEIKEFISKADERSRSIVAGQEQFALTYQATPTPAKVTIHAYEAERIPDAKT